MGSSLAKTKEKLPVPIRYFALAAAVISTVIVFENYIGYLFIENPEWDFNWIFYFSRYLISNFLWVAFIPILFRIARDILYGNGSVLVKVVKHISIGMLIGLAQRTLSSILLSVSYYLRGEEWFSPFQGHSLSSIFASIFSGLLVYFVLVGIFIALEYYKQYQAKLNELNNAQLNALKMQLHPHFLFNTLHTISSLIDENTKHAQTMVSKLGFLLRSILEQNQKHTITVKEEIEYIRSYLDIEEVRFQDRLKVVYDIDEDSIDALVPNLILQPIVENAIKHGFSKKTDECTIQVCAKVAGEKLMLVVEDDGKGVKDKSVLENGNGIGIKNVRDRLIKLYGDNQTFELIPGDEKGVTAKIIIPLKMS